jgi:hypothetical protein
MAIKVKKDMVDITQELNNELELYGFQISFNPDKKDDKKDKKDNNKKDKTTSKKK